MSGTSLPERARRRFGTAVRPSVEISPAPERVTVDWDLPVVVRDGTTLRVNVFRPAEGTPTPAIMSAHSYNKDAAPAKPRSEHGVIFQYRLFPQPEPVQISAWTSWEAPDPAFWVPRGYVVVNADLRGGGTAEGEDDLLSDHEAQDYHDLIEWVGTQPWCTGKVGLDGVSYLAINQYKVAELHPPHLAGICPWEGLSDLYRDFARPGGVREDGFSIIWSAMTRREARISGNLRQEVVARPDHDDWYEARTPALEDIEPHARLRFVQRPLVAHPRVVRGLAASILDSEMALHPPWREVEHLRRCRRLRDARPVLRPVLEGADNGWDTEPSVRLAIHEAGPEPVEVVHEQQWPPAGLTWNQLHLDAARRRLLDEGPSGPATATFATRGDGSGSRGPHPTTSTSSVTSPYGCTSSCATSTT
jgi:predicted acyl esterase